MAMTGSSESGGWGSGWQDFLFGVADKAIDYQKAKNVDVETKSSGGNVPDRNDLLQGNYAAAGGSLGTDWQKNYAGLTVIQWGVVSAVVLAVVGVSVAVLK